MLQAAARGVIDFSEAKPFDRIWQIKLNRLLREVENENYRSVIQMKHAQHVAALSYLSDPKQFEHHWKEATDSLQSTIELLFPWIERKSVASDYASLRQLWINEFGDPDDPEVAERIRKTSEGIVKSDIPPPPRQRAPKRKRSPVKISRGSQ